MTHPLTPRSEFLRETGDSEEFSDFDLEYQEEIEEMVREEMGLGEESDQEFIGEDETVGFDLLDAL